MLWQDGYAYLDRPPILYGKEYFDNYVRYEHTEQGEKITSSRVELVLKYSPQSVLDVGIGSGHFLKKLPIQNKAGLDINEYSIKVIEQYGWQCKQETYDMMTFWDSLEHLPDFCSPIRKYNPMYILMTIPLFDPRTAEQSKHYKPGEHYWYFTKEGLIRFMQKYLNYEMIEYNTMEQQFGREDVHTFCFKKKER